MEYAWIIGAVICAWAMLRVIGAERERRVRDMTYTLAAPPRTEPPAPAPKPASSNSHRPPAVRSKAAR
jgi:hypothetical protein